MKPFKLLRGFMLQLTIGNDIRILLNAANIPITEEINVIITMMSNEQERLFNELRDDD